MYQVFLGYVPLPITPSKIETTVGSRNTTVELIDGREVSILKQPSLQEISFEFILPHQEYPFASLAGSAVNALASFMPVGGSAVYGATTTAILAYLEYLKTNKVPFYLVVARLGEKGYIPVHLYNAAIKVALESYTITEDAEAHGTDVLVSVTLKQYVDYESSTLYDDLVELVT